MNQEQGLVAEAAVDGEVADVGGDDFGFGEAFGKDDEGGVAGVHLGVAFHQYSDSSGAIPDGE